MASLYNVLQERSQVKSGYRSLSDGYAVLLDKISQQNCISFPFPPFFFSLRHQGLKLTDLANLLIRHGRVRHAINMDGGGSSVLVQQHGKVLSHPTCLDVPIPCERAVSSVLCLKKNAIFERIEEERR